MPQREPDDHESRAAGLDFDDLSSVRENAARLGAKVVEEGPDVLLDEIENLLPESWRDQIRTFPLAAVGLGIAIGVWLGMRKSDEVLAAGSSLLSAAAMANIAQVMERAGQD